MNCKHCGAEMDENAKFCANCGKPAVEPETVEEITQTVETTETVEVPQEPEMNGPEIVEKKKNPGKIALAVAAVVLVLAVLVAVIVGGMGGDKTPDATEPSAPAETQEPTIPADGDPDNVTCKGSYTVSDADVVAASDRVVATMGDKKLTVSQLQVYYWLEVVYFLQDCGSYASYFGLDYTKPMDMQTCTMSETPMTWQQYFLECALNSWMGFQAMALEAEENGLEMDAEMRQSMDDLVASLEETAAQYGAESPEELMKGNFGPGATVQSYVDYWDLYYTGYTYFNHASELIEITDEDVEKYFAENEETYAEGGMTKDSVFVDVRHILFQIAGGTTDEETGEITYSEEEWEECRKKAQEILDQYLAGETTEEAFAELANANSEDPGSNTNGGLYEDVYVGEMVPEFNDWCFDESRQPGDTGLVKTSYGYHVMYFVEASENAWYEAAKNDLLYEMSANLTPVAVEKHPAEIDYSAIALGLIDMNAE